MGKVSQEALQIWNANSGKFGDLRSMVIVSQHPIDVLRMADFRGLESCHSPANVGGSFSQAGAYFMCAVEESQVHGPIAYLVSNRDYEKIKDRLQDEEIFADPARNIDGINPSSRLRIRELRAEGFGSVPMAEKAVYGNQNHKFFKPVQAWCKTFPRYAEFVEKSKTKKFCAMIWKF